MSERTDGWAKGGMRLSGAIRIGAMMHEQGFGLGIEMNPDGTVKATCALGAAKTAMGYNHGEMANEFGLYDYVWHPIRQQPMTRGQVIADLNDGYRWTRNQIADWVEQEENKEIERHERAVKEEREFQDRIAREQRERSSQ